MPIIRNQDVSHLYICNLRICDLIIPNTMFNMVSGAFSPSGLTSTNLKFYWEDFQAANISQSNINGFVLCYIWLNQEVKGRISKETDAADAGVFQRKEKMNKMLFRKITFSGGFCLLNC